MGKLLELNELSAGKTSFVSQYDFIICGFWVLDRDWHPKWLKGGHLLKMLVLFSYRVIIKKLKYIMINLKTKQKL